MKYYHTTPWQTFFYFIFEEFSALDFPTSSWAKTANSLNPFGAPARSCSAPVPLLSEFYPPFRYPFLDIGEVKRSPKIPPVFR